MGVWSGDPECSFGGLKVSIKNGLRCGAINFPYFGSDIGGYHSAVSKEVFARFHALDHDGTVEIYCRQYSSVTRNGVSLTEGTDFSFDTRKKRISIPYQGVSNIS